ncbi:unnamed protein product [Penicillium olsonii]|uniref:DNA-directed RNA polymerase III subunit n=1 Tax=Penicillium olsonii TaxID=99116 RepID=A0A9W4HCV3_PENOL|nr:unnamed protein product [Penicillium olsonii]CAG7970692.1 unnamed protein product [Penicillium olsonii]CAG7974284.1 unnamed protein product [Penicillium olsonii]
MFASWPGSPDAFPSPSHLSTPMSKSSKANYPCNQKYTVPFARKLSPAEQTQVDYYRSLREKFHDGPFYSVLDASSSNAKKGSAARANFDPFHGMPTYSGRYQRKRRTLPKIAGQSYSNVIYLECTDLKFFPRDLWQTLQPNFRPDASLDGYQTQMSAAGVKRGFEDEEDDGPSKRKAGDDDEENEGEGEEGEALDDDEEQAEDSMDDDFSEDDDDMGGDYNAEQYFDGGDDDMGDEDGGGGDDDM